MGMEITSLTAVAGLLFGLVGTALGAWNRWDKIIEDRAKKRAGLPLVIATAGEDDDGWRPLTVTICARAAQPYRVDHIEIAGSGNILAPSRYDPIEVPDVVGSVAVADTSRSSPRLSVGRICGEPNPEILVVDGWMSARDSSPDIHVVCAAIDSAETSTRRKRTEISIAATVQITSSAR